MIIVNLKTLIQPILSPYSTKSNHNIPFIATKSNHPNIFSAYVFPHTVESINLGIFNLSSPCKKYKIYYLYMKCQLELSESRGVKFSLKLFPPNKNGYFGKHNWRVHAFEYFKICEEKFNFKEAISIFFSFFLKSGYQHMLFPFFYSPKYSSVVKKDSNPNQLK